MATHERRQDTVLVKNASGVFTPGIGYRVTAFGVGATVAAASSGTTVTVDAGHGFAANDYALLNPGSTAAAGYDVFVRVTAITDTTLTLQSAASVAVGDILFNLGTDSASGNLPQYDGSGVSMYSDMDGGTEASAALCNAYGAYSYWHREADLWELIRDSSLKPVGMWLGSRRESIYPAYGSLSRYIDTTVTTVTTAYQKVPFDYAGPALGITADIATDEDLTVGSGYAGTYMILATGDLEATAAAIHKVAIWVNEITPITGSESCETQVETIATDLGHRYPWSVSTLAELDAGDTVSLRVARDTSGSNADVTFGRVHLSMWKIG